jgi:integrase
LGSWSNRQGSQATSLKGRGPASVGLWPFVSAKSKEVARRKLRAERADSDRGLLFDAENLKVEEYLDSWLTDSVRDTVRQRTFERYESIVRVHIKPALGRVKLGALTPNHVRRLYRQKLDHGLAPRTVNYIHTTLHKALKDAVSDALIPRNAATALRLRDPRNRRYTRSPRIKRAS